MARATQQEIITRMQRQFHCFACGKDWFSLLSQPKRCGKCKSPYWDRPKNGTKK